MPWRPAEAEGCLVVVPGPSAPVRPATMAGPASDGVCTSLWWAAGEGWSVSCALRGMRTAKKGMTAQNRRVTHTWNFRKSIELMTYVLFCPCGDLATLAHRLTCTRGGSSACACRSLAGLVCCWSVRGLEQEAEFRRRVVRNRLERRSGKQVADLRWGLAVAAGPARSRTRLDRLSGTCS